MKKNRTKNKKSEQSEGQSEGQSDDLWNIFDNVRSTMNKNNIRENENKDNISEDESGESNKECKEDEEDEELESELESELFKEKLLCFNCNEDALVLDDGIIVCEKCGVDNGAIIDHQQEWRFYGSEDTKHSNDPTRCGMPVNPLLPESSLGTIIIGRGYDKFRKLNNWNLMSYKERSLLKVFKNIQAKCDEQNITVCVTDRAKIMYKTLSEEAIKRGKSRKGLIAACLYNSCKDKNDIRSIKEISKMFGIKAKKMTSGCKQFNEMMYYHNNDYLVNMKLVTPEDYIERYSNLLKIEKKYREKINYVADMAYNLGLVRENTPSSIAVSSIYLISQECGLKLSKKKIAEVCEISEVTISKAYKKMQKFKKFLVPVGDNL